VPEKREERNSPTDSGKYRWQVEKLGLPKSAGNSDGRCVAHDGSIYLLPRLSHAKGSQSWPR
jgi:hypothetical protein